MRLILVPVLVPYGIDLKNPHLMDTYFSGLRHIPKCNTMDKHYVYLSYAQSYI